jgi:hypothetical protein
MLIANTDRNQPQNNTLINSTMAAPRLLLVLTEFPPSFGGMQTHALALCHWLRQRGYEFAVATYRWEDGPMESYLYDFPVHRVLSRVAYQANLRKLEAITRQYSARLIYSSTVYYGELAGRTGRPMLCRSAGNDVLRPWIAWPFQWGSRLLDIPLVDRYLYRRWRRWQWPEALEGLLMERRFAVMRNSARLMPCILSIRVSPANCWNSVRFQPSRCASCLEAWTYPISRNPNANEPIWDWPPTSSTC